jgi:hypothetical protein
MLAHLDPGQALKDLAGALKRDFRKQLSGRALQVILFPLWRNLQRLIERVAAFATRLAVKIRPFDFDLARQTFELPALQFGLACQTSPAAFTDVRGGMPRLRTTTFKHFCQERPRHRLPGTPQQLTEFFKALVFNLLLQLLNHLIHGCIADLPPLLNFSFVAILLELDYCSHLGAPPVESRKTL